MPEPATIFTTATALLIAARQLATGEDVLDQAEALADLATDGTKLRNLLTSFDKTSLAARLAQTAAGADRAFDHEPGLEDARALFEQVITHAIPTGAEIAADGLDAQTVLATMRRKAEACVHARDFTRHPLAPSYFDALCEAVLKAALADPEFLAPVEPRLWCEALTRIGAIKDDTQEILTLVRELHRIKQTTVPEDTLIALARRIRPTVPDLAQALTELEGAVDIAARLIARGHDRSNVDAFVAEVMERVARLTEAGAFAEAAAAADDALARAEAGVAQLMQTAIDAHLLNDDVTAAAALIVKREQAEKTGEALIAALRAESHRLRESGTRLGLLRDLRLAAALAEATLGLCPAGSPAWATTQNNLGAALATLGARSGEDETLTRAVAAFEAALTVYTREAAPVDWAMTQNNLGIALRTLAERSGEDDTLARAVKAYEAALTVYTPTAAPVDWATLQNNLGAALSTLGARSGETDTLARAVAAFEAALTVRTREAAPVAWAETQGNLARVRAVQCQLTGEPALRQAALDHVTAALEVFAAPGLEGRRERAEKLRAAIEALP